MQQSLLKTIIFSVLMMVSNQGFSNTEPTGYISIVIDDLGYQYQQGLNAIRLDAQVTLAVLPESPYAQELVDQAIANNKEIMTHVPMQATRAVTSHEPHVLSLDMSEIKFKTHLHDFINKFPSSKGLNNHMGSLITQHPGHMSWVMEVIQQQNRGLYFLDSRTTAKTVGSRIASEFNIPTIERNVFLDSTPNDVDFVKQQLKLMEKVAKKEGFSVAIGHPFPETIVAIRNYLQSHPENRSIKIVPLSELIEQKTKMMSN